MRKGRNLEKRFSLDNISSYIISRQLDKGNYNELKDKDRGKDKGLNRGLDLIDRTKPSCSCNPTCPCFISLSNHIEMLQADLNTAAEVGQALLKTHEDYVAESEREAAQMESSINTMTKNLQSIMTENDKLLSDNSELINQLQGSSQALKLSDSKINNLSNELNHSKDRIIKLNTFMMQAKMLEAQIAGLENVRENLQNDLEQTTKEKYLAEVKWRKAERMLEKLTNQYECLEEQSYERIDQRPRVRMEFLDDSLKDTIDELQRNTFDTVMHTPASTSTPVKYSSTFINNFPSLPSPPSSGKSKSRQMHNRTNSNLAILGPLYEDDSFKDYLNSRKYHSRNPSNLSVELESPIKRRISTGLPTPDDTLNEEMIEQAGEIDDEIDETMDEMIDNTIDETIDETMDETIDNTIDNTIDETTDNTIDEIDQALDEAIETTHSQTEEISYSSTDLSAYSDTSFSFSLTQQPLRKVTSHESILSVLIEKAHPRSTIPSFQARTRANIAVTELSTEITHASLSTLLNPSYSSISKSRQLLSAAIANNLAPQSPAEPTQTPRKRRSNSTTSILSQNSSDSDHDKSTWSSIFSRLRKSSHSTPSDKSPIQTSVSVNTPIL